MARIIVAYTFTVVMLVSQLGLPLHMHYCEGMLESVSVFFSLGCDNHAEEQQQVTAKSCCHADPIASCSTENGDCCDDEVKLLTQEITSVSPQLSKWVDVQTVVPNHDTFSTLTAELRLKNSDIALHSGTDSGPPIYLMQQALIFYG